MHRLLRIQCQTQATRRTLLNLHKAKKGSAVPEVFIRPDLTKSQHDMDKQLRIELKEKGKDKFRIFRGKIVERESNNIQDASTLPAPPTIPNQATTQPSRAKSSIKIPTSTTTTTSSTVSVLGRPMASVETPPELQQYEIKQALADPNQFPSTSIASEVLGAEGTTDTATWQLAQGKGKKTCTSKPTAKSPVKADVC